MVALGSCSITSGLTIKGGEQFVLGENEHKSFNTNIKNIGNVAVDLAQRLPNGNEVDLGRLAAGETLNVRFEKDCAAILSNIANTETAQLKVKITGDKGLGMVYE